jgi:hypothetical protein
VSYDIMRSCEFAAMLKITPKNRIKILFIIFQILWYVKCIIISAFQP